MDIPNKFCHPTIGLVHTVLYGANSNIIHMKGDTYYAIKPVVIFYSTTFESSAAINGTNSNNFSLTTL